jgi:type II secretory pathway pseudopilin PulG
MAVKLWSEKTDRPYEYRAVKELCESLEPQKETYFVFANYHITDARIDLTVFTKTSIFVIELKSSADKPINGSSNGSWTREDGISLGRGNPVRQILHYYHRLRDWLNNSKEQFLTKNKAAALIIGKQGNVFDDIKKLIVLYPTKHPDSKIAVDDDRLRPYMGNIIGFDELVNLIIDPSWESRLGIEFTPKEIEQMAELLNLPLVSLPTDTVDLSVAPTESLGEARDVYEVHKKTEIPEKHNKKTRVPQLLWSTTIAMIIIGIALFLVIPRLPRITQSSKTIDVADAAYYIGNAEKIYVRAYIDNVKLHSYFSSKYIILYSGDFTVQIDPVNNPETELRGYEEKFKGHCVIIGPSPIVAASSGNPQIELEPSNALKFIRDEGVGRCK